MTVVVSTGTVTTDGDYTVVTFETDGSLTVSGGTLNDVEYLLIAGGGNAALPQGTYVAGGGAGGVLTGNITINPGSYPVTVGAPGNNSSFLNMTANGGGQGGFYGNGFAGGSGGGGGTLGVTHINYQSFVGGLGVAGQGYPGGDPAGGGYPPFGPGGGGGAGGVGGTGSSDGVGGAGGQGIASYIKGITEPGYPLSIEYHNGNLIPTPWPYVSDYQFTDTPVIVDYATVQLSAYTPENLIERVGYVPAVYSPVLNPDGYITAVNIVDPGVYNNANNWPYINNYYNMYALPEGTPLTWEGVFTASQSLVPPYAAIYASVISANAVPVAEHYAAGGSGKGPGGIGTNSPGYTGYGAGGGYDSTDGPTYYDRLPAQPGVLIIRYLSV
jgi:hypothetical protein